MVSGEGWSGSDLVYMELCGNAGRNGSSSCDRPRGAHGGWPGWHVGAIFTVGEPPVAVPLRGEGHRPRARPSPRRRSPCKGYPVVALEDQPSWARSSDQSRSLRHASAAMTGGLRGSALAARRSLIITVKNTGVVDVHDPPLSILAGKGANPTGVVPAPRLGTIEPGGIDGRGSRDVRRHVVRRADRARLGRRDRGADPGAPPRATYPGASSPSPPFWSWSSFCGCASAGGPGHVDRSSRSQPIPRSRSGRRPPWPKQTTSPRPFLSVSQRREATCWSWRPTRSSPPAPPPCLPWRTSVPKRLTRSSS